MSEEIKTVRKEKKTSIGGQALLEGIMMRGPKRTAMAVRNLKGEIILEEWDTVTRKPAKIWTLPLFRGMYSMYSSMKVGYKCLMRSAMLSGLDELEEQGEREKKLKKLNKKRAKEGLSPLDRLPDEEPKNGTAGNESVQSTKEKENRGYTAFPEVMTSPENTVPPENAGSSVDASSQSEESQPSGRSCAASDSCPADKTCPADENQSADEAHPGDEVLPKAEREPNAQPLDEPDRTVTEECLKDTASSPSPAENPSNEKSSEKSEKNEKSGTNALIAGAALVGSVLGIVLALLLFIYLPTQIYSWTLENALESHILAAYPKMLIRSLFEGVLRIAIFVGYMAGVSLMKDIRRTFMYHGAEHKTIFCYEKGLTLTVENVRKMRRFHPRCGTSFMIVMLILGIVIGSFIPPFHLSTAIVNNLLRSLCKLALLPVTVGLGYEFIKFAGKHDNWIVRVLSAPGMWMQRISTKEPDDSMIECAIKAIERVIPDDGSDSL